MNNRPLRIYFLHNLDGRNSGIIASASKVKVARAYRVGLSEIQRVELNHPNPNIAAGAIAALHAPGVLFEQPSLSRPGAPWVRSKWNKT